MARFHLSMQMKVHFARQTRAKSNQILSAAAPDSFIFCHSTPHSCIRVRVAGGKCRGCNGRSAGGVGAAIAGAGTPASAGRTGGSGAVNGGRGLAGSSSANTGEDICAAVKKTSPVARITARSRLGNWPKTGRSCAFVRVVITVLVRSWQPAGVWERAVVPKSQRPLNSLTPDSPGCCHSARGSSWTAGNAAKQNRYVSRESFLAKPGRVFFHLRALARHLESCVEKESLQILRFKELEHVKIKKVEQLF